jgi:Tfp pilus assembly protein PilX
MSQKLHHIKKRDEQGLVSIVVVTMVIIILTLMTTGFAKIMDRELRQSLDRELAVQADYAAESGVNDARRYLASGQAVSTSGDCLKTDAASFAATPVLQQYFVLNGNISGDNNQTVKYTCVNLDTTPNELVTTIKQGQSKVFKIASSDVIDNLYFSWNNEGAGASSGSTGLLASGQYPAESFWSTPGNSNATGVLRTTVYTVPSGVTATDPATDKNGLLESLARNYFMYPNGGGPNRPGSTTLFENGVNVDGNCKPANFSSSPTPINSKHFCNSVITDMAPVTPPAGSPDSQTKNGNGYIPGSCIEMEPDAVYYDCNFDGVAYTPGSFVYDLQNFRADYKMAGLRDGNYNMTINYGNFLNGAWPPPCGTYFFQIQVYADGVPAGGVRNLNPCASNDSFNIGNINRNATITIAWLNNFWIPCGANPNCYDPNFQINSFTLNEVVPPPVTPPANAFYYVKLTALYRDLSVSIQGTKASGTPVSFVKAQGDVDVTAKGNDVLKRLHGNVSLDPEYSFPSFAVDSMDTLCKRIRVQKTAPSGYGATGYQDPAASDGNVSTACSGGGVSGSNIPVL